MAALDGDHLAVLARLDLKGRQEGLIRHTVPARIGALVEKSAKFQLTPQRAHGVSVARAGGPHVFREADVTSFK